MSKQDTPPAPKTADDYRRAEERCTWELLKYHTIPVQWAALVAAYGTAAATILPWLTGTARFTLALWHLIGYLLVVAVWGFLRQSWRQRHLPRMFVAGLLSVTWIVLTTATGPGINQYGLLLVLMLAIAAGYWRQIRIGYPGDAPPPPPAEPDLEPEPVDTSWPAEWDTYVAPKIMQGTWLDHLGVTDFSSDFVLNLQRGGQQTLSTVYNNIEAISQALNVEVSDLVFERDKKGQKPPDGQRKLAPSQVRMKIVHSSPIDHPVLPYTGPDFQNGTCYLGPHNDGIGKAPYRIYDKQTGSMWSGFIVGVTGSGKSRVAEKIVIDATSDPIDHPTVVLYTDPQGGMSSHALMDYAHGFTAVDETPSMMAAIARVATVRQKQGVSTRATGFQPQPCTCPDPIDAMEGGGHRLGCTYLPGILWVIEECHGIFQDRWMSRVFTQFAREFRKLGISFLGLSQHSDLTQFGADGEVLRQSLTGGNVVALRTGGRVTAQLLNGLDADPSKLPPCGYLYTSQTHPESRMAVARCNAPIDPDNPGESDAARWLAEAPRLRLDPVAAQVAGTWTDARSGGDSNQAAAAAQEEIDAIRRGDQAAITRVYAAADRRLGITTRAPTTVESADMDAWEQEMQDQINTFTLPDPLTILFGTDTEQPDLDLPNQRTDSGGGRAESARAIYNHVAAGTGRMADLETATGWSHTHIRNLLRQLESAGRVTKTGHGQWATTDPTTSPRAT